MSQALACRNTGKDSGWFIPRFDLVDQAGQLYLECRFHKWWEEDPKVAVYKAEELDHAFWVNYPAGQIYVREVAPPLVVTCSFNRIDDEGAEAVFTTTDRTGEVEAHYHGRIGEDCGNGRGSPRPCTEP